MPYHSSCASFPPHVPPSPFQFHIILTSVLPTGSRNQTILEHITPFHLQLLLLLPPCCLSSSPIEYQHQLAFTQCHTICIVQACMCLLRRQLVAQWPVHAVPMHDPGQRATHRSTPHCSTTMVRHAVACNTPQCTTTSFTPSMQRHRRLRLA